MTSRFALLGGLLLANCGGSDRQRSVCPGADERLQVDASVGEGEASVSPLPSTTFIFAKIVKRGTPQRWNDHLYAFDTLTGKESLITALDDDGETGTSLQGFAISPDRRWITFAADDFRSDAADGSTTARISGSVWLVSIDGERFRRLTPPFTLDDACVSEQRCKEGFYSRLRDPVFHPDGRSVYYGHETSRPEARGDFSYGYELGRVPISGGAPAVLPRPTGCEVPIGPAIHPSGRALVASQYCDGRLGLFEWTLDPVIARGRELFNGSVGQGPGIWTKDGSRAFFGVVEHWPEPEILGFRYSIFAWDACTQKGSLVYSASLGLEVSSPAVSPEGKSMVMEMGRPDDSDLYLQDLVSGQITRLTHDGRSTRPRW